MFATAVLPAIALGVGMLLIDHSPRWLAMQGRWNEARRVAKKVDPSASDEEIDAMRQDIEAEKSTSWRDLLAPGLRGALVAGVGLAVFQQFIGPNTVLFYGPTIFSYAGLTSASDALVSQIYIGLTLFAFVFVAIALVDIPGRKTLFYAGLTGMTAMLFALGFLFRASASGYGAELLIVLIVYIACYSASISPLFWLMSAEVFPTRLRGLGASWCTVANWSANLLVTATYLTMISDIGKDWTFWTYGIVGVASIVFVRFFVPETKARPLEDIEQYWVDGHAWPQHASAASARSSAAAGSRLLAGWLAARGPRGRRKGSAGLVPATVLSHFGLAVAGLGLWVAFVITGTPGLAWLGVGLIVLIAGLGMGALSAALPEPGRGKAGLPVIIIAIHGLLATTTILLVLLAAIGAG